MVYHIDSLGERVLPPIDARSAKRCAVFLIDSFSFGEGVADEETLPYRVAVRTKGNFQIVNLGVPGYGIGQMLRGLETHVMQSRIRCQPTIFVYQAMPHHVVRAAGLVDFATYVPRYALTDSGKVTYTGTPRGSIAAGRRQELAARLREQLEKSRLYRVISAIEPRPSEADLQLYLAMVRRTRQLIAANYPNAEFDVILWQHEWLYDRSRQLRDGLAVIADRLTVVDDILPNYPASRPRYELHPRDAHPNAAAYDLIAAFVVDSLLARHEPK